MKHELKLSPEEFALIATRHGGMKRFEPVRDDGTYQVGDTVRIKEWDGSGYTECELTVGIKYIKKSCPGNGIEDGWCIIGW